MRAKPRVDAALMEGMATLREKTEAIAFPKLPEANGAVAVSVDDRAIATTITVDGELIDEGGVEAGGRRGEPC